MSHQDRRLPLPPDYQFPTHGVDCDCPTCRNRVTEQDYWKETDEILRRGLANMAASQMANTIREDRLRAALAPTQTAYGWGV